MLRLKRRDDSQEIASFWVIELIKYASLKLTNYTSQNVNVNCEEHIFAGLKKFLHSQEIICKNWKKKTDTYISMSSKQNLVRDQILTIKDGDKKD